MLRVTVLIWLLFAPTLGGSAPYVKAPRTWIVDKSGQGDFYYIQEALDAAELHDSIRVSGGVFYEHLVVNKSLTLIGESASTCIIDGNGTGTVVTVNSDSVHFSGFTVRGSGNNERGILVNVSRETVLIGNVISDNGYGCWLESSENDTIRDNVVQGNVWGIYLEGSGNNTIENNTVSGNYHRGLHLGSSDNNLVTENDVVSNTEGVYFELSSDNRLKNNIFSNNTFTLGVLGLELGHFIQDIDTSNAIDNRTIYYYVNQSGRQVPTDAGYVAVVNSTGMIVKDLNLTDQEEGPMFAFTKDSTVANVSVSNARYGFRFVSCENLTVTESQFVGNAKGMRFDYCVDSTVSRNFIANSHEGIFLDHSSDNLFFENMMVDNIKGMFVYYSAYNAIYHNNFLNNESQVYIAPAKILVMNEWDRNGEGNFWSDHLGDDEDGIGATPYILDQSNRDNHPLMGLFSNFTEVFNESVLNVVTICNSTISNFECDLTDKLIRFNATGPDQSTGFCRIVIPHKLFSGPYQILIDGSPPLTLKDLSPLNSTASSLYFTYEHSTRRVTIVPEYSSMLMALFAIASFVSAIAHRISSKRVRHRRKKTVFSLEQQLKR
jgi:parallel beta-helix repeat protein